MKITFISCWAIDFVECDPILNLVLITCKDDATKPEIIVNHLAGKLAVIFEGKMEW